MPRWARFLSCTLTGLVLSLVGFLLAAYATERAPYFWSGLRGFLATPQFRDLCLLFGLFAAAALAVGRLLTHLSGLSGIQAGFLAGGMLALCYVAFLLASQVPIWGGWAGAWPRIWPAALWMALPFAVAGAFQNWLWERLA